MTDDEIIKKYGNKTPFISRMVAQDQIDKTREYLDYLERHIDNVRRAFIEFSTKCEGTSWVGDDYSWHTLRAEVERHDLSKLSEQEFVQYRKAIYPAKNEEQTRLDPAAWENHKNENHHHHETAATYTDIMHMVIDWMAMGYVFGDTPRSYYESNKENIKLSDEHVEFMYQIFEKLEQPLGEGLTERAENSSNSLTASLFEDGLNSIDWSLRDAGCGVKQVFDNKGRPIPMTLDGDGYGLRIDRHQNNWTAHVTLKNCVFRANGDDCLSLCASDDWEGNTMFIQFYRFD